MNSICHFDNTNKYHLTLPSTPCEYLSPKQKVRELTRLASTQDVRWPSFDSSPNSVQNMEGPYWSLTSSMVSSAPTSMIPTSLRTPTPSSLQHEYRGGPNLGQTLTGSKRSNERFLYYCITGTCKDQPTCSTRGIYSRHEDEHYYRYRCEICHSNIKKI